MSAKVVRAVLAPPRPPSKVSGLEKTPRRYGKNPIDPGDAPPSRYSALEEGVQNAENVDAVASNFAAGAAGALRALPLVAKFAPKAASLAPALNTVRAAGVRLAPIQAALWGLDAGRAVVDPEYREQTLDSINDLYDDPGSSTLSKSTLTALHTAARPVSTVGAMARSYGDSSKRIRESEEQDKLSYKKLKELQSLKDSKEQSRKARQVSKWLDRRAREEERKRGGENKQEEKRPTFPNKIIDKLV